MNSHAHRASARRGWAVAALALAMLCIGLLTLTPGGGDLTVAAGTSWWSRATCLTCSRAWLADVMAKTGTARTDAMLHWETAPYARTCHAQEDHLVPLFAALGAAEDEAATPPEPASANNTAKARSVSGKSANPK